MNISIDLYFIIFRAWRFLVLLIWVSFGFSLNIQAQNSEAELTIIIEQPEADQPTAAWIRIQTESDDNFEGWYQRRGIKGFPAFSPVKINVPPGSLTISAWNSRCDETSIKVLVRPGKPATCKIKLVPRFDMHKSGYFSFDGHNHLDGEDERNRPPYIYPYCAAIGIDHLDVCQLWFHELERPVSYDSIITYLKEKSTPELSLNFGSESPKLRYGHTWYINHPGLADPLGDYLNWHDVIYFEAQVAKDTLTAATVDLRGKLHPQWQPPFVDRLQSKAKGAFTVAAHPTRWWHHGKNEILPGTNTSADLAFDLIAAHSYDGLVVMGDCKDHIFYQNLWFNILNLGYNLIPVAETDGNVAGGSLGTMALTYAWTGGKFNLELLTDNLKRGHTTLSGKAVVLLTVDGNLPPGSVLPADGKKHIITVKAYSEASADEFVSYIVVYKNGKVYKKLDFREQKRREVEYQFTVSETDNSWYVVKTYGKIYPDNDLQFDVMAYAEYCKQERNSDYTKNTGVGITSPIFFKKAGWQNPKPIVSHINGKLLGKDDEPLKNTRVEIWNINEKLAELVTDSNGGFMIDAPATIDVRFTLPDGQKEQQWLFYEYPPLLDLMEDTYTIAWAKKYPMLQGGQMPWEAFHFKEIKDVLKEVHWTIKPNGKIMLPYKNISKD